MSIQQSENLCGHIQTLFANFEVFKQVFPSYFGTQTQNEESNGDFSDSDDISLDNEPINTDDQYIPDIAQSEMISEFLFIHC